MVQSFLGSSVDPGAEPRCVKGSQGGYRVVCTCTCEYVCTHMSEGTGTFPFSTTSVPMSPPVRPLSTGRPSVHHESFCPSSGIRGSTPDRHRLRGRRVDSSPTVLPSRDGSCRTSPTRLGPALPRSFHRRYGVLKTEETVSSTVTGSVEPLPRSERPRRPGPSRAPRGFSTDPSHDSGQESSLSGQ